MWYLKYLDHQSSLCRTTLIQCPVPVETIDTAPADPETHHSELVEPVYTDTHAESVDPIVLSDTPIQVNTETTEDAPNMPSVIAVTARRERPLALPNPHRTRLQTRLGQEEETLIATLTQPVVKLTLSAVDQITAYLEKRKKDGTVDPSANVSVRQALRTRGAEAEAVIMKELTQMDARKVWTAVRVPSLSATERGRIIRSSMFLKMKTHPDGTFDKYKARLVAGGDMQDKKLYDNLSSPTVSTSSVFAIIAIAAHEKRRAAVVDIGSAFLNATMSGSVAVHMRLDKIMSEYMSKINSKYRAFTEENGTITVRLEKALYGCIESASLWYENLNLSLKGLGYTRNDIDICV
jgi:Reverse transcriptase (RNA-dependent DNA polymerase)